MNESRTKDKDQKTKPFCCSVRPYIDPERLRLARIIVDQAVKTHKVFSIQGPCPIIRKALKARGWVELYMPTQPKSQRHTLQTTLASSDGGDSDSDDTTNYEREQNSLCSLMSSMLRNERAYFYWTIRSKAVDPNELQKDQIINHFKGASNITTKVRLCQNLGNLRWFESADPNSFFPRCYRLGTLEEMHAFIEDYRLTACVSFVKYIVQEEERKHNQQTLQDVRQQNTNTKKPLLSEMIDFALKVCEDFLGCLEHIDINCWGTASKPAEMQWAMFIDYYCSFVHNGEQIESCEVNMSSCTVMLQRLRNATPQFDIDGTDNMWIIKPGALSRGRGITCTKQLDHILKVAQSDPTISWNKKWVVQKYIEKPFLVHGTKFDVRQWFLVTDWNPLTVWFYAKCYLRFSTQPFSLQSMDSSIHICNNSVQKHLSPSDQRHPAIPSHSMWSDEDFTTFLCSQGAEYLWETVTVPEMKKAVISALLTAQNDVEQRKNTFELYGADFILDNDLHPWLIEINSSPTMAPSTPVTARLCRAVQEDTIRVVLDRRDDPSADTGDFELIYRQAAVATPQYLGVNLHVQGTKIPRPYLTSSGKKHKAADEEEE